MKIYDCLLPFLLYPYFFCSMLPNETSLFHNVPSENSKAIDLQNNSSISFSHVLSNPRILQSSLSLKIVRTYSGNDPTVNMGMTAIGNGIPFMIFYIDVSSGQRSIYMNIYDSNNFSLVYRMSSNGQNYTTGCPVFTPNHFYFYPSKVVSDNNYDHWNIYYTQSSWSNSSIYYTMNDPKWHYKYISSSPAITAPALILNYRNYSGASCSNRIEMAFLSYAGQNSVVWQDFCLNMLNMQAWEIYPYVFCFLL